MMREEKQLLSSNRVKQEMLRGEETPQMIISTHVHVQACVCVCITHGCHLIMCHPQGVLHQVVCFTDQLQQRRICSHARACVCVCVCVCLFMSHLHVTIFNTVMYHLHVMACPISSYPITTGIFANFG